ncbi:SDR family oxidoreductase [Mycolicibacterium sp. 22603]|uniref:SDR family oxidoreductase n=1 Tax=Mycolicibacterium sp. 22603 TaxID=3453950 RepID=UPI003F858B5E
MAKTWLITGTSSGLGRELTEQLLKRGDRVAATLRRPERLAELAGDYPDTLWVGELDVTNGEQARTVVDRAWLDLGHIDVVVSNAGYGLFGAVEEVSDADIRRQIDTNVVGAVAFIKAAVPHLRAQGGGRVIQVSSMAGQMAAAGMSLYHLSKWAVEGFVEALHEELEPFDIHTCLVEPGSARTEFGGGSMVIGERLAAYDDTPAAKIRGRRERSRESIPGDPSKMATAIISAAEAPTLPRRLILGSDAHRLIVNSIHARLDEAYAQQHTAALTDADDYAPAASH